MMLRTSVTPEGKFSIGIHKPSFEVVNLRQDDALAKLGELWDGTAVRNDRNFPQDDIREQGAKWIYEIPNAFPFRGTTYIDSHWAGGRAARPDSIKLAPPEECSLLGLLGDYFDGERARKIFAELPKPVLYALAANSTDPEELKLLARSCGRLLFDESGRVSGLRYIREEKGGLRADVDDFELFETVANNPYLPDEYKDVMVLRPGAQGGSEIVGEWTCGSSHVFEYLRRNSYIPWGHYAANMANDAARYRTSELSRADMEGLRHLYYQRIFCMVAAELGLELPARRRTLSPEELESLRLRIIAALAEQPRHSATLWGWNFGYDISASGYRLHASHQMIHQQYAMVPATVARLGAEAAGEDGVLPAYACGDLVADVVERYRYEYNSDFFADYLAAIDNNERMDGGDGPRDLVVWRDERVMLFVPKAQVSQWELQIMVIADGGAGPVGNVVEADTATRQSLDLAVLLAQRIYAGLGARMVTTIEYAGRLAGTNGQRLLYSFLPKLPWAMGAFSEAQLRFICGHFPEDFAAACRKRVERLSVDAL